MLKCFGLSAKKLTQSGTALAFVLQDYLLVVGSLRLSTYKALSVQRVTLMKAVGYNG
jgi:hypothetical protein